MDVSAGSRETLTSNKDVPNWKAQLHILSSALCTFLRRWGNRVSSVGDTRTIFVGVKDFLPEAEQQKFTDNRIKTSKYTLWNFVPKNLFEQFRRIANFYFLVMSVIALSIASPISPLTSILPLAFVILVTAVKQAYEDWLRYHADKEVNCYPVTVIRNGVLQELKAQHVKVGDVVRVVSDTEIPCDLVLLTTSDTAGKCYITTANLDGETNLKTLYCPRMLRFIGVNGELATLRARVECEQPTSDLYKFQGKICLLPSDVDVSLSPAGRQPTPEYMPAVVYSDQPPAPPPAKGSLRKKPKGHNRSVSFSTREPDLREDNADDDDDEDEVVRRRPSPRASVLSRYSEREVDVGGDERTHFKRNLSRRESKRSDVRRQVRPSYITRQEDDEEEVRDLRRSSMMSMSAPLAIENLLLRGHRLKNTEYIYGCAVYTGQETKLALNSKLTSIKFSSVEKSINRFLLFFLLLLIFEVILSTGLKYSFESVNYSQLQSYIGKLPDVSFGKVIQDVFSFVILYNYVIPISLYVTIEMQKFLGTLFFEWDPNLYDEKSDTAAICNTSDLNEELGQIQYLFTDKTGTLTENNMWFRRCSVDGVFYREIEGKLFSVTPGGCDEKLTSVTAQQYPPDLEQFLLAMAVCHSVQVNSPNSSNNNSVDFEGDSLDYQASSPDEKALVEASARLGVVFLGEKDDLIYVRQQASIRQFSTLNCLEFTSDRKRMSVIVADEDDVVWLYCKGAESHVFPLVGDGVGVDMTEEAVKEFAMRGLRAMVIGYRRMERAEYNALSAAVDAARQDLTDQREAVIAASYDELEKGLTLLGATGVEDQLQDGVQETLESLRAAGIKVWILTGDKVETAVNISFSCGHFKSGTSLLYLTEHKKAATCSEMIDTLSERVRAEGIENYGLIVDGSSLKYALRERDKFLDLCQSSNAVICCRMSPLQKCEVVQMMKSSPSRPITAAIGDGANDVSMIQEAHVGIGLMGKEGRQAVRCADFAFARFRFVRRTLLVHGTWYYLRIATLVQYFFYKNIVFITPQLFYAFYNGFSTQPLYDSWFLTLFNVIYTSLPILIYGLFEQNYSAETLTRFPYLYQEHSRDALMTWTCFFKWNALGLWHAVIIYFLPYDMIVRNDVVLYDNTPIDFWAYGTLIFQVVCTVVNLKLLLHSRYWTWIFVGSIFASIASCILFAAMYSGWTTGPMHWVYEMLASSAVFWLFTFILVIICVIPDVCLQVLEPSVPGFRRWWNKRRRRCHISCCDGDKVSLDGSQDTRL